MNYGTGAIMSVPAHDERDFNFAKEFHLAIKEVISSDGRPRLEMEKPYLGEGFLVNSGPFDGISSQLAREKITLYINGKRLSIINCEIGFFPAKDIGESPFLLLNARNVEMFLSKKKTCL